ncbi:hypothetical protein GCM10023149_36960 [Mucilaginibacter gynuensis]|uniref:Helix-hairpin-helix domain-containing protein n=1 Tax=Mucilaginibacter gynuensis TaxID=1302236 RepID=A0ABP8GX46_9SPHI
MKLKNDLSITKKEWNGLVLMLALIAVVLAAPYVYQSISKDNTINYSLFNNRHAIAVNNAKNKVNAGYSHTNDNVNSPVTLFRFDPNGLPAEKWKQLGLTDRQITVIKHYEAKGGRFFSKHDVQKMYSLSAADYERLEAYIALPEKSDYTPKPRLTEPVELNTADSVKLTTIHGIGPVFASRIIKYRQRLGGYISKVQLKEVYGVDDKKYNEIADQVKINPGHIQHINPNTATFDDFKRLPYLTFKQMNAIIQYRLQHGDYNSVADMQGIAILTKHDIDKIKPYLIFK